MVWYAGPDSSSPLSVLYTFLLDHYTDVRRAIYKFDHYLEMFLFRDQGGRRAADVRLEFIDETYPGVVRDFRSVQDLETDRATQPCTSGNASAARDGENQSLPPRNCGFVCFPLEPKPHQVCDQVPWVKRLWVEEAQQIDEWRGGGGGPADGNNDGA